MSKNEAFILTNGDAEFSTQVKSALDDAMKIVRRNIERYTKDDEYPVRGYANGKYRLAKNGDDSCWVHGFWPGELWLAYDMTGDKEYLEAGEKCVESFYKRVYENYMVDWHHDIGFLYTPACVAGYSLTGNKTALEAAKMAAYSLSRRFRHRGEFIQSMGFELQEENYRFIADTMLNLPLLFWMTEETGDEMYRDKAKKHLDTTIRYLMREDGSSFHHFLMDCKTGEPVKGLTWQGHADTSCWSRGHSWLVLGFAIAYAYLKEDYILDAFYKVTDYFIEHLPEDYIPYWDFDFTEGDEPRDSSAAAIAVCGILEMAKHISPCEGKMKGYVDAAKKMLSNLIKLYGIRFEDGEEGLLRGVVAARPQGDGEESCQVYGDYYYMEALVRATKDWKSWW